MRVGLVLVVSLACACGGPPDDEVTGSMAGRFVDSSARAAAPIEGLYYGELEIVAYDYRPGQAVQTNAGWGTGADWSYWVTLQSGGEESRDNLLTGSGEIDFPAPAPNQALPGLQPPSQAFVDAVGAFDIDLYEVSIFRPGVVHDGAFYGYNAGVDDHPLHKYPEYADIPDYTAYPEFPGFVDTDAAADQAHSVLFARDDWFPEPVLVWLGSGVRPASVLWSSATLTTQQQDILISLVDQGTQRRFYNGLIVVPMPGPVRVVLDDTVAAGLAEAAPVEIGSAVEVTVSYDLSQSLDDASDFTVPRVLFAGDANHVPFGITAAFAEVPEAIAAE